MLELVAQPLLSRVPAQSEDVLYGIHAAASVKDAER